MDTGTDGSLKSRLCPWRNPKVLQNQRTAFVDDDVLLLVHFRLIFVSEMDQDCPHNRGGEVGWSISRLSGT